jgi:hypothetical protein
MPSPWSNEYSVSVIDAVLTSSYQLIRTTANTTLLSGTTTNEEQMEYFTALNRPFAFG